MARDHGAPEGPSGGLVEEAPEDVEGSSAEIGEEFPVVMVGQWEQRVPAEILAEQEMFPRFHDNAMSI